MPEVRDDAQSLMVAVRVRPVNDNEVEAGCTEITHVIDDTMVVLMDPTEDQDDILRANRSREKQYVFDMTLGPKSNQAEVYGKTARAVIDSVLDGYNATVFAYGPTGAGKTYTMLGTDEDPGIMVRTLNDLFKSMEKNSEDSKYKVTMSYLEIYNEMIRDLLNPSSGYLDLREDSKGVVVAGLSEAEAKTPQEVMYMLTMGNKQRTCEPTAVNKTSSRSHAVLQVTIRQSSKVRNVLEEFTVGKLFMIDLAGSERASQTQNRGKRLIEGAHINRSLLALGNCINALSEKGIKGSQSYVNYRDSKLTRLLKDSLGGNCKTVMIAHISPASICFEESRNTLNYADRAKNIKMKVKRNHYNVNYHIAQYQSIIAELRQEILRLKTKMAEKEFVPNNAIVSDLSGSNKEKKELDKIRGDLVSTFQEQMEIRRELIDLEDSAMRMSVDYQRHILVIDEWDQEKAKRRARKEIEQRKLNQMEGESNRSSPLLSQGCSRDFVDIRRKENEKESSGDADSEWEPADVTAAKEELQNIVVMEKDINDLKADLQIKLSKLKQQRAVLEDSLPRKISSDEHREVLKLLCSVHELELKNAELESMSMLRDHLMQQKDLTLQKQELKQKLMDEIILLQRSLLEDHDLECPADLEALYQLYLLQIHESDMGTPFGSTANLNAAALSQLHVTSVTPGLENKTSQLLVGKSMPTLSTVAEDGSFASRKSKKRWTDNFSDMESEDRRDARLKLLPRDRVPVQAPVFVRHESSGTVEDDSVSELVTLSDAAGSHLQKTKVKRKRVRKKTKAYKDSASETSGFTHSPAVKQTISDSKIYNELMSSKRESYSIVRGSHSMIDLSQIDDAPKEIREIVKVSDSKPPFRQRSSSLDAGREKLRLKQQFREEKKKGTRPKPLTKNGSDSRIPVGRLVKKSQADVKLKLNVSYPEKDEDMKVLTTSQTPPVIVHQSGTPQGRGQKIQKSYRLPLGETKTSSTTSIKHRPPRLTKSIFGEALSVSGTSMIPKQSRPGIKRF